MASLSRIYTIGGYNRLVRVLQETPPCHAERSEASPRPPNETLRYAQGDTDWQLMVMPIRPDSYVNEH
jgi:hypothetical protein